MKTPGKSLTVLFPTLPLITAGAPSSVGSARSVAPDASELIRTGLSDLLDSAKELFGDNRLDPRILIAATAAASSSRTPPSRPLASPRSRVTACPLCGGRRRGRLRRPRGRWLWRQHGGNPSPPIAALAASDLTILHPRGVLRRLGKRFFVICITSRAQLGK